MPSDHSIHQPRSTPLHLRLKQRSRRGFTLVEAMIATMVFTMGILGVYAMMIKSYELVSLSRHRDNARAFLVSFSDEFLRLQTTDMTSTGPLTRPLFNPSGTPGDGLNWTDTSGNVTAGTAAGLVVPLGTSTTTPVMATITRQISYLDSTGTPAAGNVATAAGWILQGTFTITYSINGRPQTQSITVARAVP